MIYLIPIIAGILVGIIFTLPVSGTLIAASLLFGFALLWQTKDHGLGGLVGVIAMAIAAVFSLSAFLTIIIVNNLLGGIDWSWLIRS